MLTKREIQLIYSTLKMSCTFFVLPYELSFSENDELSLSLCAPRTLKRRLLKLYTALFTLYAIYSALQLAHILVTFLKPKTESIFAVEDIVICAFFLVIRFLHVLIQITLMHSTSEFAHLINLQSILNSRMGIAFFGKPELEPNKIREILLQSFILSVWCLLSIVLLLIAVFQNKSWFMYSIVPSCLKSYISYVVFLMYEGWVTFHVVSEIICVLLTQFVYLVSTNFWLHQLRY